MGGDLQPQKKELREMEKGEGFRTAGSCEGLMVSMETHSSLERRRGLGTLAGGFENERFTKEAPSSLKKASCEIRIWALELPAVGAAP